MGSALDVTTGPSIPQGRQTRQREVLQKVQPQHGLPRRLRVVPSVGPLPGQWQGWLARLAGLTHFYTIPAPVVQSGSPEPLARWKPRR